MEEEAESRNGLEFDENGGCPRGEADDEDASAVKMVKQTKTRTEQN
jgi:hypothetical protein